MNNVAICIATYRRPHGLERLLKSLAGLHLEQNPETAISIIIVDNDEFQTGKDVVDQWRTVSPWPTIYDVEPNRGISYARNRLVELARASQFLAFIDDDEVAHPDWLDELLTAQKRFRSRIVAGPVIPRFATDPPRWIDKGRFFERKQYSDGQVIDFAGTGNVLIETSALSNFTTPFDARLALAGGSDTLLFFRLRQSGLRIVFATRAIVEEIVPPTRMTIAWLCKRAYRAANTYNICKHFTEETKTWIPARLLKSFAHIGIGILAFFPALPFGRTAIVKTLTSVSHGAGGLAGVLGKRYFEYHHIHGD